MTKKQIRKAAYQAIVKEGLSHQECFDKLRETNEINIELLANEVAKIPSSGKSKQTAILRYAFIGVLVIIMILRSLGIISLGLEGNLDPNVLILLVLLGIFLPAYGIYGAITGRIELYYLTGIFLTINTVRGFLKSEVVLEPETFIGLIPVAVAVILSVWIPWKLKTPFKKTIMKVEFDGLTKDKTEYTFEDTRITNEDLLDSIA